MSEKPEKRKSETKIDKDNRKSQEKLEKVNSQEKLLRARSKENIEAKEQMKAEKVHAKAEKEKRKSNEKLMKAEHKRRLSQESKESKRLSGGKLCLNCANSKCWYAVQLPYAGEKMTTCLDVAERQQKERLMIKYEIGKIIGKQLNGQHKEKHEALLFGCLQKSQCHCVCQERRKAKSKAKVKQGVNDVLLL
jgi:hypothetical protein